MIHPNFKLYLSKLENVFVKLVNSVFCTVCSVLEGNKLEEVDDEVFQGLVSLAIL